MDLDALSRTKRPAWDRLAELGSSNSLTGREADELIAQYQAGAGDLATIQTVYGATREGEVLSQRLSRARNRFTGAPAGMLVGLLRFFGQHLPAALYRVRWWTLGAAIFTIIAATLIYFWASSNPAILTYYASEAQLEHYQGDFIDYYSEYSESSFAARVFTNNAWIAAQCILFGVTGFMVPYVLLQNANGLGTSAAVLGRYEHLDVFFLWIMPHGLLELTMVFVAAGAGLKLFWSWIVPGARTRLEALAEEGRAIGIVAIGTTIFLFISGLIEGYVTRQDWPWAVKIGIGVLALTLYLMYALYLGRKVARTGERGDLIEFEAGARRIAQD